MTTKVGELVVHLSGRDAKFRSMMTRASGSLNRLRGQLTAVSLAAAAAFAPLAALGKSAVQTAGDFERGMARTAAVAQVTSAKVEKALSKTVLNLAAKTEFTARQVADAAGNLAQLGFNAQEIMGALPSALELASAGMMDVAEASAIAAKIMRSQGFATADLARVNDVLVSSFTGAAIDVQQLGEAFKFVGSIGKTAGVQFEELAAALGQLGNVGIPAEVAGTGLRRVIAGLLGPTGKSKKLLDELGLSALMASTDGFPKLADIVGVLERRFKDAADEGELAGKIVNAFGQRAGPVLLSLVGVGSQALRDFTHRLEESGGTAQRIAQKQLNTFSGRMKILQSQIEGLAISVGDRLIPIIDRIAGAISGLVGYFRSLPGDVQQTVVEMAAFTTGALGALAAISGLTVILSPLMSILGLVGRAILTMFSTPLMTAAGIVGGFILILGSLRKAWDANLFGMKDGLEPVLEQVKDLMWAVKTLYRTIGKGPDKAQLGERLRAVAGIDVQDAGNRKIFTKERNYTSIDQAFTALNDWLETLPKGIRKAYGTELTKLLNAPVGSQLSGPAELGTVANALDKVFMGSTGTLLGAANGMAPDGGGFQFTAAPPGVVPETPYAPRGKSPAGPDLLTQVRQDIASAFEEGAGVIKDAFAGLGSMAMEALPQGALDKLAALEGKATSAVQVVRDLLNAIQKGGISTKLEARGTGGSMGIAGLGAASASVLGVDLLRMFRGLSSDVAAFGDELYQAQLDARSFANRMDNLSEAAKGIERMGFLPRVGVDENGNKAFDVGSILGGSKVGDVASAAGQGALAGGPIGAVIGALVAIVASSDSVQENLQFAGETLGVLGEAFGAFARPMRSIHGQTRILTEVIGGAISPILESFGKILQAFAPVLALVATLFQALTPIFEIFADIIGILADAVKAVVQAFVFVFRPIILVVLGIIWTIAKVWNAVMEAFRWVFAQLGKIPLVGGVFDAIAGWFEGLKVETSGLEGAMHDLKNSIKDDPFGSQYVKDTITEGADKFNEGAEAAKEAGNALKNVPEGFKTALERFRSMDVGRRGSRPPDGLAETVRGAMGGGYGRSGDAAVGGLGGGGGWGGIPGMATGGIVTAPTLALIGEGRGPEAVIPLERLGEFMGGGPSGGIHIANMTVVSNDPDDMLRKIERKASRQSYLQTGMEIPGAPRYTGRR